MSVSSPVMHRPTIPPRQPRHPPTSPDSFRATPSSSPMKDLGSVLLELPYILAPDSRPASPTSQGRIDKLAQHIRDREVRELYVFCAKLRGPFGPGASKWGIGDGKEAVYDDEDLVLPECEEHALELERQKKERRAAKASKAPDFDRTPRQSHDQAPPLSFSSRSTTLPVLTLSTPRATSTPASVVKHSALPPSSSQSRLGFGLTKPSASATRSKDGKYSLQPDIASPAKRVLPRFASSTLQSKPRTRNAQLRSSQPTPFNSQFDVDSRVKDLSHLLEEDGFEVERGVQGVGSISSDDE